jgi:hypothetical protein
MARKGSMSPRVPIDTKSIIICDFLIGYNDLDKMSFNSFLSFVCALNGKYSS